MQTDRPDPNHDRIRDAAEEAVDEAFGGIIRDIVADLADGKLTTAELAPTLERALAPAGRRLVNLAIDAAQSVDVTAGIERIMTTGRKLFERTPRKLRRKAARAKDRGSDAWADQLFAEAKELEEKLKRGNG